MSKMFYRLIRFEYEVVVSFVHEINGTTQE